ncbi:MAG: DUF4190 domain-containing protein [Planctomycetes bacterium]|nr:DUF4190 domain-containing protein [Planctomycetota bacterium]
MSIDFDCYCGVRMGVPDEQANTQVRCPGCGRLSTVPPHTTSPPTPGTVLTRPLPPEARTSRAAIWSAALGAFGFLCCPAPVALLLGVVAIVLISNSHGAQKGTGLAALGILLSLFWVAALPFARPILEPWFLDLAPDSMRRSYDQTRCRENLSLLGAAVNAYVARQGQGEGYPPGRGAAFLRRLPDVEPERLRCPARARVQPGAGPAPASGAGRGGRAYRGPAITLSGDLPAETAIACDEEGQHAGGIHALYLDGHVEFVPVDSPAYREAMESTTSE